MITIAAALCTILTADCSRSGEDAGTQVAATASSPAAPVSQEKRVSELGDLWTFRGIAIDVAALVDTGDLAAARRRINALEVAWDEAEAGLEPRAADDCHTADRAVDQALSALRANLPGPAECKAAMSNLLNTFDTLQGQPTAA